MNREPIDFEYEYLARTMLIIIGVCLIAWGTDVKTALGVMCVFVARVCGR